MSAAALRWEEMAGEADPLADRTIAAIVGPCAHDGPTAAGAARLAQANRLIAGWTTNASLAGWNPPDGDAEVVAILRAYLEAARSLPEWADAEQIACAEDVFMSYGPLSCTLLFCASLPECYVLPHLAEVLHIAGQLELRTEYRIRQTAAMVFPVMMKGGLTAPEGGGVAQTLKVRLIHAMIRHLILRGPAHTGCGRVEPLAGVAADATLHQALLAHGWDPQRQGLPCNQMELAYTLLTFHYVFLRGMRKLAIPLTASEEQAYLHAWNVVGHVLGIRDELMPRTMQEAQAMFDDLQALARARPAEPDMRPPLGRALIDAMAHSIELPVLRHMPVPLTRWLVGRRTAREIGANRRVGLPTMALFHIARIAIQAFDRIVRLAVPTFSLTRMFTRVVGYHMLTRFLLDQTRPLALPVELLQPLRHTVACWKQDAHAPRWVGRVEARLTTQASWRPAP